MSDDERNRSGDEPPPEGPEGPEGPEPTPPPPPQNGGSAPGSRRPSQGGQPGSQRGSAQGSQRGSAQGSQRGSAQGSQRGSAQGSQRGSAQGSQRGSAQGSRRTSGIQGRPSAASAQQQLIVSPATSQLNVSAAPSRTPSATERPEAALDAPRGTAGQVSGSALLMAAVADAQERERAKEKKARKRADRQKRDVKAVRKRASMPLTQAEINRVKHERARADRQAREKQLIGQHYQIMDVVAMHLNVSAAEVKEGVIDAQANVDLMESFVSEGGRQAIIFCYGDMLPPPEESGRVLPLDYVRDSGELLPRVVVTDGSEQDISGHCVAVYRSKLAALDERTLFDDLFFSPFEVEPGSTTVAALSQLVARLHSPALGSAENWGDLPPKARDDFLYNFANFAHFLSCTSTDLDQGLRFALPEDPAFREMTPQRVKEAALRRDEVAVVEQYVQAWSDQIQEVLTVRQQIRREREDIGPRSELVYWRRCLAKYTSIIEHLKSPVCQNFVVILVLSKSKLLARWKKLDSEITEATNEAADTVKYMYGIQRLLAPLYQMDPPRLASQIPGLMTLIRNVYSTSRFYNTTERLQVLLVKVTNQILNSCRAYLTANGNKSIWIQGKRDLIQKMQVCIRLQRDYEKRFEETKAQVARCPLEGTFDCSSMYIFGKFKKFCGRLLKIVYVLETTLLYSVLQVSCIEGIEEHAQKFVKMYQRISSQPYDPLNYRREEFDVDFEAFKRAQQDAEEGLYKFMRCALQCCPNIHSELMLIKRFEKLGLDCLEIQQAYEDALDKFLEEIESLRDRYNDDRQKLLVTRNLTPIAGRILWARQFYERIAEPMNVFREQPAIHSEKAQKVIKHYNALAMTLVHYEIVHHSSWCNSTQLVSACLAEPILARDSEGFLCVNYNQYLLEVVRETECFWRMGLQVPEIAQVLTFCKKHMYELLASVTSLVTRYTEVRSTVPRLFAPLMRTQLQELEATVQPGLNSVMWTSLHAEEYIKSVKRKLDDLEAFLKEVSDMKSARVDAALAALSETELVWLPPQPVPPKQFLEQNLAHAQRMAQEVALRSATAEGAVKELINRFADMLPDQFGDERYRWLDQERAARTVSSQAKLAHITREEAVREVEKVRLTDISLFHNDCMDMFGYFNAKNIDALVKCNRLSLELLRKRDGISLRSSQTDGEVITPLFAVDMVLQIPRMVMIPALEEANTIFNSVIANIMEVNKAVRTWGQDDPGPTADDLQMTPSMIESKTLFKTISEHREVTRTSNSLTNVLLLLKPEIVRLLEDFTVAYWIPLPETDRQDGTQGPQRLVPLWEPARLEITETFVRADPLLVDIRDRFVCFEEVVEEIEAAPSSHDVGCFQVNFNTARGGLLVEAQAWKDTLGRVLCQHFGEPLEENVKFIADHTALLQRQIKDLDDVRIAMAALHEVAENFIALDLSLTQLEDTYALLTSFQVKVAKEDLDCVNTLRYNFNNMVAMAMQTQVELCAVQEPFREELVRQVKKFKEDVDKFDHDFETAGPMVPDIPAREASDRVLIMQGRLDDLLTRYEIYRSGEELFGLPVNEYPTLMQKKRDFNLLNKLYSLYNQVMSTVEGYYDIVWAEVNIEVIMEELAEFQNRCGRLPKGLREWPAYLDLKQMIDDFNGTCPLLEMMTNKAMKDRHWKKLEDLTNCSFDVESETFTLKTLLEAPLLVHIDDVTDICLGAVKERDIEAKMEQVKADWAMIDLVFVEFKNRGELLLRGTEASEIIAQLEDSLMVMGSLLSNRYNSFFKKEIQNLVWKLSTTSEIMEQWMVVQNLWVYLEAVFSGGDIAKELPGETKKFNAIDKSWVKIMTRARDVRNVLEVCVGDESMQQLLPFLLEQLESCQKSLSRYLEQKRLQFPRFFFVSDPALLEILGQASDSHTIQDHLLNVFENVAEAEFDQREYDKILAVKSREGERIPMDSPVMATGGVEVWLNRLLAMVRQSVNTIVCNAVAAAREPEYEAIAFIETVPAQVALLHIQMLWTQRAERALTEARFNRQAMPANNQFFLDLLNMLIDQTTRDLSHFLRVLYETLITIHVHQRDIFDELCRMHVKSPQDFEWLKQARFYFDEEAEHVNVGITDVNFIYQNEYLGNTDRLVITPLTDRCYITLAQSIGMHMGGAPAGPAGTGKTETTKDMGKALGKYVVVFNCSDQMDFRGLGRIFKGLAQSGSWGCFDEFNRIELPVLSVAAQQIYIVLSAKKQRQTHFLFSDGDLVSLNPEFGLFITMNPGYAGRQELPENLKIQFRSVAMMVPDRQIIIRVKLASCGFRDNVLLARKFFTLYKLCEDQLSKQVHYDFGLRNILSCLRTLGAQRRANPQDSEETTVMRVLRDMNLSKLVDEDEPLFLTLIDDLFPGIRLPTRTYKELQAAIAGAAEQANLVNHPGWNLKLVQLYETSLVRHGLMIVGPTGAGKTTCIQTLMKALTECGSPHKEMRMNPKAITAPQMFGRLDVATNDWTDGIFSTLWRKTLKVKKSETTWLVLDGPVDAVWIENLNSVLDDNKTLTLANGDRIVMAVNCKLLFEPDNLDNASPATVSRMGMVFMSSSCLPWGPILEGWLLRQHRDDAAALRPLFEAVYEETQRFLMTRLHAKMHILEALYIRQCTDVLEGLMIQYDEARTPAKDAIKETSSNIQPIDGKHLERMLLFAIMWSLGAALELEDRAKLEEFVLSHESKLDWPKPEPGESIFEFMVTTAGVWEHWRDHVEDYVYPEDSVPEYASILVPNVDNVRTAFLVDNSARFGKSVLLIGEQGTAKTVMIQGYMSKYDLDQHLSKGFSFSSATTPNMVQRTIESYVDKRVGTTYGPSNGRKMTLFIDDINMPVVNEWGDQITNEIVRQLMEMRGFYSLDKPGDFSVIQDVQYIAAMIHPGGGRNDIPNRLKRQFSIFNCTLPSNSSMDKIFGVICSGYFCRSRFKKAMVEFMPRLVELTRVAWQRVKTRMLPTPAKFHYVFNLRDISRIWQGILTIKDEELPNKATALKLWRHECTRVIADKLTTPEDREWLDANLGRTAEEMLGEDFAHYSNDECYFVDFMREMPEPTGDEPDDFVLEPPKIYEEVPDFDFLKKWLVYYMEGYNQTIRSGFLDLVLFHDAIMHLCIISRIIRAPRGSALLVGVGGSGKQSLTRLATHIAGYKAYQIAITRTYNAANLLEDLKLLYRMAGCEGRGVSFIFTDNEIKDEGFLEYINNVLSAGEVANLFSRDEMDEIMEQLTPIMKKEDPRRPNTRDNLYAYFLARARANLHVVLCFSPVGEKFRARALKFPGLISGCTIDWFFRWPKDALIAVSQHFLANFDIVCQPDVKESLMELMGEVQDGVAECCTSYFERYRRQTHVTPKSFLFFLDAYKSVYTERNASIAALQTRMSSGLGKLAEAVVSVEELQKEMRVMEKDLAVSTEKANEVLAEVTVQVNETEKVKADVQAVAASQQVLVDAIDADRAVANERLEAARPALEAAEQALLTIKATDIATVRKLAKPPYLITVIMDVVIVLFGRRLDPVKPDPERQFLVPSWGEALKVVADVNFLKKLQQFPKDMINEETIDLMGPYLNNPLYTFENAKTACGNVAGLLSWTVAMAQFYSVNKEVLPLKAKVAVAEAKLNVAMVKLKEAEALLAEKEKDLSIQKERHAEAMAAKQVVQDQADQCSEKISLAQGLINGLAGERVRWQDQLGQFWNEIQRNVGDVLLLTGFLSYAGPFNQEYRTLLQRSWLDELLQRRIPVSGTIRVTDSLADQATTSEWNLQGLPNDELSIQNGIIVTKASRFPLLIDPQGQGKLWIKNKEKDYDLQVTSLNHKYFRNHLEDCLGLGRPLLIEDVLEELDPCLDNVLERNYIKVANSYKVKVGDKEVEVNTSFRLYITTKLPNPSYTPEVSARTSIIDFAVNFKGLEDQLLGRVILTEKREMEMERINLVTGITENRRRIQTLESNLLIKLTTVQGSLVDDPTVMEMLNVTKNTAQEVQKKLAVADETEKKINAAREEYRPVATRGSVLYFLVVEMAAVNCMYQTSLVQFLERFDLSMERSQKSPIPAKRIGFIIDYLTHEVFRFKSRGLYENDKFLFVLLMALKVDLQGGHITHEEFQTFVKGGAALDLKSVEPKPFRWLTDTTWLNLVQLSQLKHFASIVTQVTANEKGWRAWYDKDAPEEDALPDGYHSLDVFRKLLVVRAFLPDRTLAQSRKYVVSSLGPKFAEPVILNLEVMLAESRPLTPMVCFLSMGSDPTPGIEALAKRMGFQCRAISMGQGQEVHARKLVQASMEEGGWVLLQNCHLGLEYMVELTILLSETESVDPDFRLFITTEVSPQFPISLLQMSIKFTNEPPQGIRAGLKATYSSMDQELLEYTTMPQWLPLLFTVSFLHTVVQERRKFGPLGWNIPYEFNSSDWYASTLFIQNHLEDVDPKRGISWSTVRYMIGEVMYGGRVTDDLDKRLLNTLAKVWFSDKLFEEDFVFYKGYPVVKFPQIEQYLAYIEEMPQTDPPMAYGLHANANITYQTNMTSRALGTILSVQPKDSSAGTGETREQAVTRLVLGMQNSLPPNYDPFQVMERLREMNHLAPMNIFLRQEIDRMQKVINVVRATLRDLLLAIEGTIIMNESLRDALDNIYDARVPTSWKRGSWESSTLGFWYAELIERNQQFSSWLHEGRPHMFWMTGFFNPTGFLTAMRQETTRNHKGWSLDQVTITNTVSKAMKEEWKPSPKDEGVSVYGLYLDGAQWDRRVGRITESHPKTIYSPMPVVNISAQLATAARDPKLYMCPVYKKPRRTDLTFITNLWLTSLKSPDHWVLRGVAMLCDTK